MTRSTRCTVTIAAALAAAALAAAGAAFAASAPPGPAAAAYEKVKALAGTWEGKDEQGNPVSLTYEVVSGGWAVVEKMATATGTMVTLYHPDGDLLMATHYCEAGNQPRMRTEPIRADAASLRFSFLDVTNLAKPTDPHMRELVVTFQDPDHLQQRWTFSEGGKETPATFVYARKR